MRIDVVTIFPNIVDSYIQESIIKRAILDEKVEINVINLRHYSDLKHNQIDDTVYGGGAGMLLMFPPFYRVLKERSTAKSKVILPSPKGKTLTQKKVRELAKLEHIIILCGHYEGIDHRINYFVDEEISVGDYILTGGELAALVLVDSITRLLEGVITLESHLDESFETGLLEHPQYTKPRSFANYDVPDVLLSGHHENISKWRRFMALKETLKKRPDLLKKAKLSEEDKQLLQLIKEQKDE
ncbi:MAG: tRNA (guanosine(37)-N1)-methyltransferase TrmD [Acholeplasmataceae bacterium]|jgi:tRNA (guanine37-N1)-methyltransferase|nr:tRNA (guanosine(37)-N1)-methyltransferase TrmD [Acholeplasmataceae bacterium]